VNLLRDDFDKVKLGSTVRYWRIKRGIDTVGKLAELCGCSKSLVGKIEKGDGLPSVPILCLIARVLEITLDDLVSGCLPEQGKENNER
jgi:transcriptional regulator with XRE-family HTH domain